MKNYFDKEIDEADLRTKYKSDPLLRTLIDFFASQPKDDRSVSVTDLCNRMGKAGIAVRRADVIRMLQSLQGGQRGWFWAGRKGHDSRFDFHASSIKMAKVASGQNDDPAPPLPTMINHKFRLRADLEIGLELPADLTDKEVTRIADFLKTLPFDHAGLRAA
ncbi:MAG TPA: hypothetical protein VJU77_05420 [Chthoniobacterales bacterium]|nr:hypothetical protein [Chthoniobacterales bacterium]